MQQLIFQETLFLVLSMTSNCAIAQKQYRNMLKDFEIYEGIIGT